MSFFPDQLSRSLLHWWTACLISSFVLHAAAPDSRRIDLNGEWTFSINGRVLKKIKVPSTYWPVGGATLERTFDLPALTTGERLLLRFDGLVMTGRVWMNGQRVGEYGPYTPFTIDVTERVQRGTNRLRVDLDDLGGMEPWGRNWVTAVPRFGGIIRDVYLERKPAVYIENARLDYRLSEAYTRAECKLHVWVVNTTGHDVALKVSGAVKGQQQTHSFAGGKTAPPGTSEQVIDFAAQKIALWSPEQPRTYDLSVELRTREAPADRFDALTGFREFVTRGRDFFLSGKRTFLKGIFRHDMYGDQGMTLSPEQMKYEIADIKSLGCNFLRLGHYPQHARISELAARSGLLLSGEPPIFAMSQKRREVVEGAKFCLGGWIRRDWNNPAFVAWFISNEAGTNLDYMKEMTAFTRHLDPGRLVSIVSAASWTEANAPWADFRAAGIDFIARNAYEDDPEGYYAKLEKYLPDDLPFVVSEWGGNQPTSRLRELGRYYLSCSNLVRNDGPQIAGLFFWEYQDIPMQRWSPEGLIHWAVVDEFRRPYENYYALKSLYTGETVLPPRGRVLAPGIPEQLPRAIGSWEEHPDYETIDLSPHLNSAATIRALQPVSRLAYPEGLALGKVAIAGLPFVLNKDLVLLSRNVPQVRIPVGGTASEIEFLGHVCFNGLARKPDIQNANMPLLPESLARFETPPPFKGYPHTGEFGEAVAEYKLVYEDGQSESIRLDNGVHFADYRLFSGTSRVDAVAVDTERVLQYKGAWGAELYQMRLFSYRPKRPEVRIQSIDFNLLNQGYVPILAAVTIQKHKL